MASTSTMGVVPPSSPTVPVVGAGDVLQLKQEVMPSGNNDSVGDTTPPTSTTGVVPPSSPTAPAVGGGDVLQLKEEVMPSGNNDSPGDTTPPAPMNPLLLAAVCLGSSAALKFLLDREDKREPPMMMPTEAFLELLMSSTGSGTGRTLTVPRACDDVENGVHIPALPATARLLQGLTPEGDTALHVVATHGDSKEFLECASIINTRVTYLLFVVNNKGDTPLHCAARAGKSQMLSRLISMARRLNRMQELLRKKNVLKETALHEAVLIGNKDIVTRLMDADPLIANYPEQGTSPLYLAIWEFEYEIAEILYGMSNGNLSYDGPHGKNALHAATYRGTGITKLILTWKNSLAAHRDSYGSTPLHFASCFWNSDRFSLLFEANPAAVYQADNKGLFPIHVAASVGTEDNIRIILDKYPSSARLRTAQGRTFLHVAVEKRRLNIVSFVCRTESLSWILNMRDNDGNTAMHLAVQSARLRIFTSLYGNKRVHLSLANYNEETPFAVSLNLISSGMDYAMNTERLISKALAIFGYNTGLRRDLYQEKYFPIFKPEDEVKEAEKVKDSCQILGIGSVLIATVAFGATFAVPGGFIADDHTNRGTPTLAGRYTFDAFMMANALAFICSSISTIGLMFSGTSLVNLRSRQFNLNASVIFMSSSVTCLSAAFALGVYMVLAPAAHATGVAICVLSPLVVLYKLLDGLIKWGILARPVCHRMGLIPGLKVLTRMIAPLMFVELWPFVFIFGWAAIAQSNRNH